MRSDSKLVKMPGISPKLYLAANNYIKVKCTQETFSVHVQFARLFATDIIPGQDFLQQYEYKSNLCAVFCSNKCSEKLM